jgi:type IV secretory pathway VirB10-like protein
LLTVSNTRAFRRNPLSYIPFLAAHQRGSASMLAQGKAPNAQRYPAVALALAAVAVAVTPLATSSATHPTAAAKPAAAAVVAKPAAKAPAAAPKPEAKAAAPAKAAPAPKPAAPAPKPAAPAAPAAPYAGVSMAEISPTSAQGYQQTFTPDSSQWSNATAIVKAAHDLGLSPYAATIAVATSLQESTLRNLTSAVDHDSLGLFQQRPSMGWGSPSQLTDPTYAAKAFLKQLPSDYNGMSLSTAAQSVQRSFDGSLYAQWQDQAKHMVYTIAHS